MDLTPAIMSAVAAAIAAPLFMALARHVKVLRHEPDPRKPFVELEQEYARWELWSVPLSLVLVSVLGGAFWFALHAIYLRRIEALEPSLLTLALPPLAWVAPALFFAIFAAALPLHAIYRLLLGRRRYAEYIEYTNQKFSLDSARLFRYLANAMLPLCLGLTLLAFDYYARVTERELIVNDYLGVGETRHRLDAVKRIERIELDGEVVRGAFYVLHFADGLVFDFRRFSGDVGFAQQRRIARLAAAASDVAISRVAPDAERG